MLSSGAAAVSSDEAIRAYIRERRRALKISQDAFAKAIRLPFPTYRDWESGQTQELKARPFAGAVAVLHIPAEHIMRLGVPHIDLNEAKDMATRAIPKLPRNTDLDAVLAEELDRKLSDGHGVQRVRAAHIVEQLAEQSDLFDQWITFGEYLLGRRR